MFLFISGLLNDAVSSSDCTASNNGKTVDCKREECGSKFLGHNLEHYFTFPCLWVPVTTAWRVLRLRMEERPPIWRVAENKLNKQSRTADKGWSSSLGCLHRLRKITKKLR